MPVRYKMQNSLSFTQTIRLGTVRAFKHIRYRGYRTTFVFSVIRLLSRRCHNISSIPWAFCVLLCPLLTSVTRSARLSVRSVPDGTRNGSPGVNPATFDARLSDIPNTAKQRIEDFVVCCRLVPSVPSLIRLLFVSPHLCLRLLSGWRYRFPLPSASLRLRWGWPETLV